MEVNLTHTIIQRGGAEGLAVFTPWTQQATAEMTENPFTTTAL